MNLPVKYRPQKFLEIVGQEHIVKVLQNSLELKKISQVYLFSGPRGVGKTTTARIFAKALNCEKGINPEPCGECATCKAIQMGKSMDVIEIDGASHRGIAEVKELQERISFVPSARYKVVIIDEVHMLTMEAFNALLKTLEEPPKYVVFILATTAPERVPPTILSRCQRFDFRPLTNATIIERLKYIAEKEKIEVEEEVYNLIAQKADGSLRDAINILAQLSIFSDGKLTEEEARKILGIIKRDFFVKLFRYVKDRNVRDGLALLDDILKSGYSLTDFIRSYTEAVDKLLKSKVGFEKNEFDEISKYFSKEDLVGFFKIAIEMEQTLKYVSMPYLFLEYFILKLILLPRMEDIEKILNISEVKKEDMAKKVEVVYNKVQSDIDKLKEKILKEFDLERF